jgi:hypothetical protein
VIGIALIVQATKVIGIALIAQATKVIGIALSGLHLVSLSVHLSNQGDWNSTQWVTFGFTFSSFKQPR